MTDTGYFDCELRPRDFHARVSRRARGVSARGKRTRRSIGRRSAVLAAAIAVPAMAAPGSWTAKEAAPPAPVTVAAPFIADASPEKPRNATFVPAAQTTSALVARPEKASPMLSVGTGQDRFRAGQCLAMAAYYEAASEGDEGMRAVAQVVLNRVAHPAWPNTVCGVVFQGSERSTGCQFTFTCDGSMARAPSTEAWRRARRVADAALGGSVYEPVGMATHYHTRDVHPYWSDTLAPVGSIGAHLFFNWRGSAGRKSAFNALYRGMEPEARPHARVATPASAMDGATGIVPQIAASAMLAIGGSVEEPEVAIAPQPTPSASQAAPKSGDVKPEYARTGQWLRKP